MARTRSSNNRNETVDMPVQKVQKAKRQKKEVSFDSYLKLIKEHKQKQQQTLRYQTKATAQVEKAKEERVRGRYLRIYFIPKIFFRNK